MNDDEIIAHIRECLEIGNYEWSSEHLDHHMLAGGFDFDDMTQAVVEGEPFEIAIDRDHWLFCGTVPLLREHPLFRGRWLHVDVHFRQGTNVAVVTAYRPLIARWETETRRKV